MGKTTFFNNGEPQIERTDGKMQPIIISDEDKICGPCWDCFWAPCLDTCGMVSIHFAYFIHCFSCSSHDSCSLSMFFFLAKRSLSHRCLIVQAFQRDQNRSATRRNWRSSRDGRVHGTYSLSLKWPSKDSIKSSMSSIRQRILMMNISFFQEELLKKHVLPLDKEKFPPAHLPQLKLVLPQSTKWMHQTRARSPK